MAKNAKKQNIFGFRRMGIFRSAKMPKSVVMHMLMTPRGYGNLMKRI
jgi:hypothetical protein